MWTYDQGTSIAFSAALLQIPNQLLARFELGARRLVAIEIANETNAESDVVQIIAVDVAPINLTAPAIADFDLAVARRSSVSNNEMVRQSIPHSPNLSVIVIESSCVALPRAAVVHDDELPATSLHRRAPDLFDDGAREVTKVCAG